MDIQMHRCEICDAYVKLEALKFPGPLAAYAPPCAERMFSRHTNPSKAGFLCMTSGTPADCVRILVLRRSLQRAGRVLEELADGVRDNRATHVLNAYNRRRRVLYYRNGGTETIKTHSLTEAL